MPRRGQGTEKQLMSLWTEPTALHRRLLHELFVLLVPFVQPRSDVSTGAALLQSNSAPLRFAV